jgi:mRNA interferase RelE/StbE
MHELRVTAGARSQLESLPLRMQARVQDVFLRLVRWPDVSGLKPLRGKLRGAYRIRAGDWRVLFTVDEGAERVTVFRIANRRDVYED